MAEGEREDAGKGAAPFWAGMVSVATTHAAFQPFDVLKTRLIGESARNVQRALQRPTVGMTKSNMNAKPVTPIPYRGCLRSCARIAREDGILGLWKGGGVTIPRVGLGAGIYFTCVEYFLPGIARNERSSAYVFAVGALARSMAVSVCCPISVVKTRIAKFEGVSKLYAGLVPALVKDLPYAALYLHFYLELKALARSFGYASFDNHWVHFPSAFVAGSAATLVTQPAEVVKTRLQLLSRHKSQGILETAALIWKEDRWRGLFRGSVPRVFKRGITNGLSWTLYEFIVARMRTFQL